MAVTKCPSEIRRVPIELGNLLSAGASLTTVSGYVSRKTTPESTTFGGSAIDATTLSLNANPGIGAFLTVNDGGSTEETFKVTNVTGSAPWVCTIRPAAMYTHSGSESIDYEPGVNARLLVSIAVEGVGDVVPLLRRGAIGHIYRVSAIGVGDNGEEVEGEVDLIVSEVAAIETRQKQPSEIRDLAFGFSSNLDGGTLQSAVVFVSHEATLGTTVAGAGCAAEASIIPLTVHPGIGALITVGTGLTQEIFSVSAVSGAGPYDCTITPTAEFPHTPGETVSYEMGETTRLLVSSTVTVLGSEGIVRSRRGDSSEIYRVKMLGSTSLGEVLQHTGHLQTPEL